MFIFQLLENKPLIPITISDQIRLWFVFRLRQFSLIIYHWTSRELERDRVQDQEGMLYNHFNSTNDFYMIEKCAKVIEEFQFSQVFSVISCQLGFKCTFMEQFYTTLYCRFEISTWRNKTLLEDSTIEKCQWQPMNWNESIESSIPIQSDDIDDHNRFAFHWSTSLSNEQFS